MTSRRAVEVRLFAALWLAYAAFHQGGGWNQNARFAQVRAVVEQGRLAIDDYLVYSGYRSARGDVELVREPVVGGEVSIDGERVALAWRGAQGRPVAVDGGEHRGLRRIPLEDLAATGDVAFAGGRFYPNKAPGTTALAVPAYFVLHRLDRALGWSPDGWWVLTVNAWLTSALSVGIVSALAGLAVYRLARRLVPNHPSAALATAVTYGLGTLAWPYATMLYEHGAAAAGLAWAFLLLLPARDPGLPPRHLRTVAAGVMAGFAAAASYAAAPPAVLLGVYALARRGRRSVLAFAIGLGLPGLAVLAYHAACFGGPLTTGYQLQNPAFLETGGALLGVFQAPAVERLAAVSFSPFRGLFVTSPVLLASIAGSILLARQRRATGGPCLSLEGLLAAAMVAYFLAFNVSFNGWAGGWAVGPRYLVPALPFLALPLAPAFRRWPRTVATLAVVSILVQGLVTAVDPQSPVGSSSFASAPGRAAWRQNPLGDYLLPLFLTGAAAPLVAARPDSPIRHFQGPVSAAPMGVYEAWLWRRFPPGSREARWSSFNAGELLFPGSRWSLLPLLLPVGLVFAAFRGARPVTARRDAPPARSGR